MEQLITFDVHKGIMENIEEEHHEDDGKLTERDKAFLDLKHDQLDSSHHLQLMLGKIALFALALTGLAHDISAAWAIMICAFLL